MIVKGRISITFRARHARIYTERRKNLRIYIKKHECHMIDEFDVFDDVDDDMDDVDDLG